MSATHPSNGLMEPENSCGAHLALDKSSMALPDKPGSRGKVLFVRGPRVKTCQLRYSNSVINALGVVGKEKKAKI